MTYRLPAESVPCKFEQKYTDWVDYGSTRVPMETFECGWDGEDEKVANEIDKYTQRIDSFCGPKCPGYSRCDTEICQKHDYEFTDYCSECEIEAEESLESSVKLH